MASGGSSVGGTITNGIQDLCSSSPSARDRAGANTTSAPPSKKGFLYAAAAPIVPLWQSRRRQSGFQNSPICYLLFLGSKFDGAKTLAAAGFKPEGTNLSLIMLDEEEGGYCCEKRLESMMEELHVDDSNKISVSSKTCDWNIQMTSATAISSHHQYHPLYPSQPS